MPDLERGKWYLWHGNVFRDLQVFDDIELDLETYAGDHPAVGKLSKAVSAPRKLGASFGVRVPIG